MKKNSIACMLWGSLLTAPFWCYAMHSCKDAEQPEPVTQSEQPIIGRQTVSAEIVETSSDDEQDFWQLVFAVYVLYNAATD